MRRAIQTLLLVMLGVMPAGCGPSDYEQSVTLNDELRVTLRLLIDALKSVEDEASAKVAAPKIDEALDRYESWIRRAKAGPKLSKEDADRIVKEEMPGLMALMDELMEVRETDVFVKGRGDPGFKFVYERMMKVIPKY